jgi:serine/threonine-protein kinase
MSETDDLIFGKYAIIRRLALGGMGEVFLARQTGVAGFNRLVILKSLLPELAEQPGFVDQFLDEARVAAKLNHPNIVGIFEVGLWNGTYFIAMEHIHGEDLARLQKAAARQQVGIPFQVSARMILDAAQGLDHAHYATDEDGSPLHIVHRDISPQNIMVRGDGVTKVVDFGIAKATNRETRTATGMLKGKLQYMPPEQVRGEPVDGRADQFALGVVLWELTTGRRLFKGGNELETLEKLLKEPVPAPSTLVDGFPPDLEAVIMKSLARDQSFRYERCSEMADELRSYLESCSRKVEHQQVSEFVKTVLGEELDDRTKNLEPTKDANFLISFSGPNAVAPGGEVAVTPTLERTVNLGQPEEPPRKNAAAIAIGVVGALGLLGIGLTAFLLGGSPDTGDTVGAGPVDPPPPPVVQPEVKHAPPPVTTKAPKKKRVRKAASAAGTVLEIDEPAGARVFIDGKEWPKRVPTRVTGLKPGPHKVVLQVDGGEKIVEQVRVEAQPAVLSLTSEPTGASIWLDGNLLGKTPKELSNLPPDMALKIKLTFDGYKPQYSKVRLKAGKTVERAITLEKRERRGGGGGGGGGGDDKAVAAKPKADGYLTIATKPWTKVSIDGSPHGSTPVFKIRLRPGKHKVRLVNEQAGIDVTKTVTVTSGGVLKKNWSLK